MARVFAAAMGVILLSATSTFDVAASPERGDRTHSLSISVLSSRPDLVTGGDALVRVAVPNHVDLASVLVTLNGADVRGAFRPDAASRTLTGLVQGLRSGDNRLRAHAPGAGARQLQLTDFPITGPVFSGRHEQPFICQTQEFVLPTGAHLGPALDQDCSVETRVDYVYRSTDGTLKALPSLHQHPHDLATTTISTRATVPYIVRVETGTINRAIYETAVLHDPVSEPAPDAWTHPIGWNGRLIYTFGGGCPGGWYIQGKSTGGVTDDVMLRQGYAVASASLNVFGNNCNDLLAAETMDMVKEHFIKSLGVPFFTIGWGCSGGSYQSHQIGDNYPGLLDGIVVGCSFPEVGFATIHTITDARLLDHFFSAVAPGEFSRDQQKAVSGFAQWESIPNLAAGGGRIDPRIFCPADLPPALRYDPVTNPHGARCDVYDHTVNVFGHEPQTGFARRPLDNVGIQYGLDAMNSGQITVDQFLDLNAGIGGFDRDANFVAQRTQADLGATRIAYQSGRLLNGGGGLRHMPIIDYRAYTDDRPSGDIHMRFQSFSTRERLKAANGTFANQVMLEEDFRFGYFNTASLVLQYSLQRMDQWLTGLVGFRFDSRDIHRILQTKPRDLVDSCWTRDANPQRIVEPQVPGIGTTKCNTLYPIWPSPRMVAGGPLINNQIKCRTRPIDMSDFKASFTPAQRARLTVFAAGVCDWSRPGYEQQGLAGTWLSFGPARTRDVHDEEAG